MQGIAFNLNRQISQVSLTAWLISLMSMC